MPQGHLVRPQKWNNVIDLYDDGDNSAIWGNYDGNPVRRLGVRWNDGYPSQGRNPLWYVEPDFVTESILLELLGQVNLNAQNGNIPNILLALKENHAYEFPAHGRVASAHSLAPEAQPVRARKSRRKIPFCAVSDGEAFGSFPKRREEQSAPRSGFRETKRSGNAGGLVAAPRRWPPEWSGAQ